MLMLLGIVAKNSILVVDFALVEMKMVRPRMKRFWRPATSGRSRSS
jgi:multidrug efflux pump subunit AcrB